MILKPRGYFHSNVGVLNAPLPKTSRSCACLKSAPIDVVSWYGAGATSQSFTTGPSVVITCKRDPNSLVPLLLATAR